jgi:CheY-like chemotaxis protein
MVKASEVSSVTASAEQVICLEPGQPDYRILIVEDQRENWLLLQRLLQAAGFQVRVVEDGGLAVENFRMWRPHFIWMDLRLPMQGGMETARLIRKMEGGREVKIVAVTASAFTSAREEVLASGFDDFMRKPYRPGDIFDCMGRLLGVRYVYGTAPRPVARKRSLALQPKDIAALPAPLREELEKAVISLDSKRIALLVRQISEQNESLGAGLASLVESFAYTPIFEALESCRGPFRRAKA